MPFSETTKLLFKNYLIFKSQHINATPLIQYATKHFHLSLGNSQSYRQLSPTFYRFNYL